MTVQQAHETDHMDNKILHIVLGLDVLEADACRDRNGVVVI